ncbi:hypothetical protein R1flu_009095 [Riccia fluitans]|uniref:AT1G65230-like protein n=1 Tax=Riccia fluitans TaxID=41844 RepID=A0ABD1Z1X9_9MARC
MNQNFHFPPHSGKFRGMRAPHQLVRKCFHPAEPPSSPYGAVEIVFNQVISARLSLAGIGHIANWVGKAAGDRSGWAGNVVRLKNRIRDCKVSVRVSCGKQVNMPTCVAGGSCISAWNLAVGRAHALSDRRNASIAGVGLGQLTGFKVTRAERAVNRNGPLMVRAGASGETGTSTTTTTVVEKKSEADRIVDGMTFSELCDEFECISSPAVEKTARQLARDLLDLREEKRTLSTYAINVTYKDPLRSFKGRDKFKRPSWIKGSLNNPTVAIREMQMMSTSKLNIKWTLRGTPKLPPASVIGGELVLSVNSVYTVNQISGQVTEQVDEWDLSGSNPVTIPFFYASKLAYSAAESGKDLGESITNVAKNLDKKDQENANIYSDPTDPRKFFQVDDNPQKDIYQVGFFIALIYLLVQFLKLTL